MEQLIKNHIPYSKPSITDLEVSYVTEPAANRWCDQCYACITRFEELFKEHLSVNYAIAICSFTDALQMVMAAPGAPTSEEVIMADTNWIETASPVIQHGAKPDPVLIRSWNIAEEVKNHFSQDLSGTKFATAVAELKVR